MKPALTLASLLTLALLAVAAVRENYWTEWRVHQRRFERILLAQARDDKERVLARSFSAEIRQVVVPDLGAVDRCVSCHLGLDDPRMADAPQPFRSHPTRLLESHDLDKFGCTACHGGQGRATTKQEAHADKGEVFWERPLLPAALTQSSCGVCHDPSYLKDRGAPGLARGRELFLEKGCLGCHKLAGQGGPLGPRLDGEGDKAKHAFPFAHLAGERTVANWHREHLKDPRTVVPASKMPKLGLDDRDLDALTSFLLSLRSVNLTERMTGRDKYQERHRVWHPAPLAGRQLYQQFCSNCHGEGVETLVHDTLRVAVPSIRNPDFLEVASEDLLFRSIRDGRPETEMPAWGKQGGGLTDDEIRNVASYLLEGRATAREIAFVPATTADPSNGKRLYEESCSACHGVSRGAGESPWLGGPGFQETYSDALIGHSIKHGRAGTLMNPYGKEAGGDLTDQEVSDLVSFIRTLRQRGPAPTDP